MKRRTAERLIAGDTLIHKQNGMEYRHCELNYNWREFRMSDQTRARLRAAQAEPSRPGFGPHTFDDNARCVRCGKRPTDDPSPCVPAQAEPLAAAFSMAMHPATWPCAKCGLNREIPQGGTCAECAEPSMAEQIEAAMQANLSWSSAHGRLLLADAIRAAAAVPPKEQRIVDADPEYCKGFNAGLAAKDAAILAALKGAK